METYRQDLQETMELAPHDVHLWWVDLNFSRGEQELIKQNLSSAERARADKFKVADMRGQYEISHGVLRSILSRYLDQKPANICISQTNRGKPFLTEVNDLHFNLAHVGDQALIAVSRVAKTGVDLEEVQPEKDLGALARRVFSPLELEEYLALPVSQRVRGFYCGWTRKEAYLKAVGVGIGASLREFAVNLAPDQPARLLWVKGRPVEPQLWTVQHLELGSSMIGALAVRRLEIQRQNYSFRLS